MTLCGHLQPNSYPLQLDLLIDAELTWTDALLSCTRCGQPYLLELLDQRGCEQLFRIRTPDISEVRGLLHDLSRGSCDLQRAGAQLHTLQSMNPYLPRLLWLEYRKPEILDLLDISGMRLPADSWRSLPCDGEWFAQLRL